MANDYMYVFSTTGSTWSVVVAPCVDIAFDLTSRYDTGVRIRTVRLRLQTTIGYIVQHVIDLHVPGTYTYMYIDLIPTIHLVRALWLQL